MSRIDVAIVVMNVIGLIAGAVGMITFERRQKREISALRRQVDETIHLLKHGDHDDERHRAWVIEQALRILRGERSDA